MRKISPKTLSKILEFSHFVYGLKTILRFKGMPGWEDADWERWDSVSEHTHRMALLAILLEPYLIKKVNLLRTLKMILIHDVVELIAKDYSPLREQKDGGGHAFDAQEFTKKYLREISVARSIFARLPDELSKELNSLFVEYINTKANPKKATNEGKFAYALDKIEAVIQIIDWRRPRKNWEKENFQKSIKYLFEWSSFDPVLKQFCKLLKAEGEKIVKT